MMKLPTLCLTDGRCCCPAANAKQQGGHKLDIPLVSYYVSTLDERLRGGLQDCFTGAVGYRGRRVEVKIEGGSI